MNINKVSTVPNGTLEIAEKTWQITTGAGPPLHRPFRQILYFRFPLGSLAAGVAIDGISIDEQTTVLDANFLSLDYNARNAGNPSLFADADETSQHAIITLKAPQQILKAPLASPTGANNQNKIEFFRVDGNVLTPDPTITRNNGGSLASKDFVAQRFAIKYKLADIPQALPFSKLSELKVRSFPAGPRIGIANPADLENPVFFFREPVEINPNPENGFALELQRYLDAFFAGLNSSQESAADSSAALPDHVEIALVLESDAPCKVAISDFNITFNHNLNPVISLAGKTVDAQEEKKAQKQTLRFPEGEVTQRNISIPFPGNATVTSATIKIVESFGPNRPLPVEEAGVFSQADLSSATGIHLGVNGWVAKEITVGKAKPVSGIALGLIALASGTELSVTLQEDWQGIPSGKILGEGVIRLPQAGKPGWKSLKFTDSTILSSQLRYWIVVKAVSGQAIWITKPGDAAIKILEQPGNNGGWKEKKIHAEIQALLALISRSNREENQPPLTLSIQENVIQPALNQTTQNGNTRIFNLASAVNQFISSQPSAANIANVPLTFTALGPGIITVFPPEIEFDVL